MGNLNTIVQKVFHLNMPLHQICASTVIYWPPKWVACVPLPGRQTDALLQGFVKTVLPSV